MVIFFNGERLCNICYNLKNVLAINYRAGDKVRKEKKRKEEKLAKLVVGTSKYKKSCGSSVNRGLQNPSQMLLLRGVLKHMS